METSEIASVAPRDGRASRRTIVVACICGLIAFAGYAATACRTITWWEGSSYSLAAATLGVTAPPGSLLLTLLGWLGTRVPVVHPLAFQLNLLAALIAAVLAGLVCALAIRLATPDDRGPRAPEAIGGTIAGLTLAFATTVWTYAVQFTPYVLSACFAALILLAALWWWEGAEERERSGRLLVLFLLFGLDVSVHRTSLLALPAALAWVTLRRPRAWLRPTAWAAMVGGFAAGLALQLLIIPMSARGPFLNLNQPHDLPRLWAYVSLEQQGGGFLVNLWPRRADFVHVQLGDFASFLRQNLIPADGGPLRVLPVMLALVGLGVLLRGSPRLGLAWLGFFVCAGLGAVAYFNLPPHYFRPMGRHYLPALVALAPLMGVGAAAMLRLPGGLRTIPRVLAVGALGVVVVLLPWTQWTSNHRACDLSRTRFADNFARDLLEPLPPRAVLLTNGDNDTFPLWYLQQVEGVRRDVTVINLPCANTGWFLDQLRRRDPDLRHLLDAERGLDVLLPAMVRDTVVALRVEPGPGSALPPGMAAADSITLRLPSMMVASDRAVLDLLLQLRWQRPVHVAVTVPPDRMPWLWPYVRISGLTFAMVPSADSSALDLERLRRTVTERLHCADLADTTIVLDRDSLPMVSNYLAAFVQLAEAQLARGDPEGGLETLRLLEARVPPRRLGLEPDLLVPLRAELLDALKTRQRVPG